jgi:hypothetical protein
MFRISKYEKGFVVEVQKRKWYGKKYWVAFLFYLASKDIFHYSTYDNAMEALLRKIKIQTLENS